MADRGIYTVRQGADHQLVLASSLGDIFSATCVATVHRLPGGRTSSTPDADSATSYDVTNFAGDSDYGPGYYLTLQDTATALLEPGIYWAQAKITYSAPSAWTEKVQEWLLEVAAAV